MVSVKDGFSIRTIIGDSVDNRIYINGTYEEATTRVIRTLSKQCDCFIDVGCNIGYYSCLYGTQNDRGKLICIDPNPEMIKRTRENLSLNRLQNAVLLDIAAGPEKCKMTLNVPQDRHSLSSLAYVPQRSINVDVREIQVAVEPLSEIIQQQKVDNALLKIDAEGFEHQVFSGLSKTSVQAIKYLIFELSIQNLQSAKTSISSLFSFDWMEGFDIFRIPENGSKLISETVDSLVSEQTSANILLARRGTLPNTLV